MSRWSASEQVRRLTSYLRAHRPRSWWHALGVGLAYLLGWAVIAVPVAYHAFMTDERATVIAGHDVVVSPTRDGWATIDLGAFLPDVRYPTDRTLGVTIDVGATNLEDYNALIQRYAVIASQPEGEIAKVGDLVTDMALGRDGVRRRGRPGRSRPLAPDRASPSSRAAPGVDDPTRDRRRCCRRGRHRSHRVASVRGRPG